jgi:predicted NAD/FAD-dependent oxidoreductase
MLSSSASVNRTEILIIGGGMSGLCASRVLTAAGRSTVVIEKGRSVGGRMATRRLSHGACDHGAQFFTARSERFQALVSSAVDADVAALWSRSFARAGEEQSTSDGYPRYRGNPSMNAFPKWLAQGQQVRLETTAISLGLESNCWRATTSSNEIFEATSVFLSAPIAQSLNLLDRGDTALPPGENRILRDFRYHPCFALMLLLEGPSAVPHPGGLYPYGQDVSEPISWIADNSQKGVSPGFTTLTVHAGSRWSAERLEADPESVKQELIALANPWLGKGRVLESQLHRWRYSKPVKPFSAPFLRSSLTPSLYFIGDAFEGAKIEGAALSGWAAAEDYLGRQGSA